MIGIGPGGPTGDDLSRVSAMARDGRVTGNSRRTLASEDDDGRTARADGTVARGGRGLADEERSAWAALSTVTGLGPVGLGRLLAAYGTAAAVLEAALAGDRVADVAAGIRSQPAGRPARGRLDGGSSPGFATSPGVATTLGDAIIGAARGVERLMAVLAEHGVAVIALTDDTYPARLRAIELPPPVLFALGDHGALSASHAIAVVGTRRPTDAGRRTAARLAAQLVRRGASVVSGLAVGIDGVAHAAAAAERGRTVAVLGSGHGHLYPRTHRRLVDEIVATGGAIVSELPPATRPSRGTFPRRNRLISGLSDATVVVEAGEGSGALITAGWALEQGRDCFAVPGPLDAPASRGCLALLREYTGQVRVVAGLAELMEDLGLGPLDTGRDLELPAGGRGPDQLGALEATLAAALVERAQTADELADCSRMPVAAVLGAITLLEARGLAVGVFGRYQATPRLLAGPAMASLRERPREG